MILFMAITHYKLVPLISVYCEVFVSYLLYISYNKTFLTLGVCITPELPIVIAQLGVIQLFGLLSPSSCAIIN